MASIPHDELDLLSAYIDGELEASELTRVEPVTSVGSPMDSGSRAGADPNTPAS